jgi:hypothetical protein
MEYSAAEIAIQTSAPVAAERRRYPRKRLCRKVVLKTTRGEVLRGNTIEMSANGISVMLDKPLSVGLTCALSFDMFIQNRNVVVTGVGKVMNCSLCGLEGFRIGMLFAITDPQVHQLVAEFLT